MNNQEIKKEIINYFKLGNPKLKNLKEFPTSESLISLGYVDSFGIIESISFLEKNFKIKIKDDEITLDNLGTIDLMSQLVLKKLDEK
tara:strand:+ start:751 stop:1011 length:261 start_codon:yes stop_codon:yes gene_type:complete